MLQKEEEIKKSLFDKSKDGLKLMPEYVFAKIVSDERMRNYMISELA